MVKDMLLCCVEQEPGDGSFVHLKFLMDGHLAVAQLFASSDSSMVSRHLDAAQKVLDSICAVAGDGEKSLRKKTELRFQCFLACSQILYEAGGELKIGAYGFAKQAKDLVPSVSGVDLGTFCYNCAVREHRAKQLDSCIGWVQLSVDSLDRFQNDKALCRSLRLLVACLLDSRQVEQAKKTAMLAMDLDGGSALTLAMLCRVHLAASDESQGLENALSRLLQASDLTLTSGVDLCQELRNKGSLNLSAWALRQLADRFAHDPSLGILCLEQLRLAIQMDEASASSMMTAFASRHHAGTSRLSPSVCAEMVRICFDMGVKHRADVAIATGWIGLAVSMASSSSLEADGRAQLHRLLATIYLEANEFAPALTNAKSAVQLCPTTAAGHYLLARCMMNKDTKATSESLAHLAACKDFSPNMMFNLASLAQSQGLTAVMIDALERFIRSADVSTCSVEHLVAASRALIRAVGTINDSNEAARMVTAIFAKCKEAGGWNVMYPDARSLEGEWAATAIYNLAGAALTNKCLGVASSLFDIASVVCSFQTATAPLVLPSRRLALTCFLDVAASCTAEQLEHASAHLKALRLAGTVDKDELLLLEFRVALLDPNISAGDVVMVVSRYGSLSSSPFLFERMASACLQHKVKGLAEAAMQALMLAFRLHTASRPLNVERASTVVRNLVNLSILVGADSMQFSQFREMADLVKTEASWPMADRQYLAIEIWNLGARDWRRGKLQSAETWCSLAMGLAKVCGHTWQSSAEMKAGYNQLLATIASGAVDQELR